MGQICAAEAKISMSHTLKTLNTTFPMMHISLDYAATSFNLHTSSLSVMTLWPFLEPLTVYKDA